MSAAPYQTAPQVALSHLHQLACNEFTQDLGIKPEDITSLANDVLIKKYCSVQASDLAKEIFKEYARYYKSDWKFSPDSHHCFLSFFDDCKTPLKSFLGDLFTNIVGKVLEYCKIDVDSLSQEQRDVFTKSSVNPPLEHFHLVRNPSKAEVNSLFSVSSQPANQLRANAAWNKIRQLQEKAGQEHKDETLFTVMYIVSGEMTEIGYQPNSEKLCFSEACFNIWVGKDMARVLKKLGVPKKIANFLALEHSSPMTEPKPGRVAFVASVRA